MRILGEECDCCGKVITKLDTGRGRGRVGGGWRNVWCSADCRDALRFYGGLVEILLDVCRASGV